MCFFDRGNFVAMVCEKRNRAITWRFFYSEVLGLKTIFDEDDTIGLGIDDRLCVMLRLEDNPASHHQQENKGPVIISFGVCKGKADDLFRRMDRHNIKRRGEVKVESISKTLYFIEDPDGNEVCLSIAFPAGMAAFIAW